MLQNFCHRWDHKGIYYWLYKFFKQMQHTVCQDNVHHHHLSRKVTTFRSTAVTVHISSVFHQKVITSSTSGIVFLIDWCHKSLLFFNHLIVLNAHFSQSIQIPMESSVIFLLSSCTITTIFFPMPLPCHFSGNLQCCFTVLVNVYKLSDNYRLFIVLFTSWSDAIFNHSSK